MTIPARIRHLYAAPRECEICAPTVRSTASRSSRSAWTKAVQPSLEGFETIPAEELNPAESSILEAILEALQAHPDVVWAERFSVAKGKLVNGDREVWMSFGFAGLPDILGQRVDGKLITIETKKRKGRRRTAQRQFVAKAKLGKACAGFAESVDDAIAIVETA